MWAADGVPITDPQPRHVLAPNLYDPTRGLDANGRIPKVAMPTDVPTPQRWRYVPEGRIPPGNFIERFFITAFAAPFFFYEEDVGAGGGVAITDIDFRAQHRREFLGVFASATTEGQEAYAVVWNRSLNHRSLPEGVIIEERSSITGLAAYERSRTRRFFGLGSETSADDETSFTDEVSQIGASVELAVPGPGNDWVLSAGTRWEHHNLASGLVSDHPSTEEVHPQLVADADSTDLWWTSVGLRYDTRDSQANAYGGWHLGATLRAAPLASAGDVGAIAEGRGGWAARLWSPWHDGGDSDEENPPTDTLVLAVFVQQTFGDLPFYALPSLGGNDTLRGYIANRFTDRAVWHATAEYRFWPIPRGIRFTDAIRIERVGLALFYDVGSVADEVATLDEATVHDSYGIGLRIAFERAAIFRIDVGFSDEDTAVTATFGLSL